MRRTHPRLPAAVALAGLGLTFWTLESDARAASDRPIRVTSTLPPWVAPGGRVVVRGVAEPNDGVALRADGRVVAQTQSDPRGGYVLGILHVKLGRWGVLDTAFRRAFIVSTQPRLR